MASEILAFMRGGTSHGLRIKTTSDTMPSMQRDEHETRFWMATYHRTDEVLDGYTIYELGPDDEPGWCDPNPDDRLGRALMGDRDALRSLTEGA